MNWDAFVCHASEDKDSFVRPLVGELVGKGLRIWYDEHTLKVGDSLRRSIDQGLADSDYGIVVLSPSFFRKEWPQKELDGLAAREAVDRKVILPVWHGVSRKKVVEYSPTLADRKAVSSSKGIPYVADELLDVIRPELADVSAQISGKDTQVDTWKDPLAPLTLSNLISYATLRNPSINWEANSPSDYDALRILHVNTMAQLIEAVEGDSRARRSLKEIYQRLLSRNPDWAGIFSYQPWIHFLGRRGTELVEQAVLASAEYRKKRGL